MSYTFQSVENSGKLVMSSKICSILDGFKDYDQKFTSAYGRIKALFGKPVYETENLENLFSYYISAVSEDGETVYLEIYCAGSGLAVGGKQNELSRKAARALVDYIWQAEPVDYAHKAYYMDGPVVVDFGIKDGVPYYNESVLELSQKEFKELYDKLY